jgi:membrane protease YdiL (CAAX protease family)
MDFPLTLVLLSIPSLIYLAVRRWRGDPVKDMLSDLGWSDCRWVDFAWGLGIAAAVGGLGWLAARTVPPEILGDPSLNISGYSGLTINARNILLIWFREAVYIALGEEIFFRGFLGGILIRRFGFAAGNAVQALIFLLPHLLLLLVSPTLLPIVLVQLVAGWLLGWLCHSSGSILPGWLAHSVANTLGALAAMM